MADNETLRRAIAADKNVKAELADKVERLCADVEQMKATPRPPLTAASNIVAFRARTETRAES
jgi:hypothetical protein